MFLFLFCTVQKPRNSFVLFLYNVEEGSNMNEIKLIMKGFVVGLGKIIPGVSGGMLAIALGIYEDSVQAVAHFFSDIKKNSLFLGMLGIGVMLAIAFMSGVIEYALGHYYLPTMLLFIGLMLGGFSSLRREVEGTNCKQYAMYLLIPSIFMILLQFTGSGKTFLFDGSIRSMFLLFLFGMIDAITMIVPGISGTAILMLLGCYTFILETFSNVFTFSQLGTTIQILLPFGLGVLVGAFITIKIVSSLLERHSIKFHYVIISFFLSSIFLLLLQTWKQNYSISTICISFLFFFIGYFISKILDIHYNS